MNTVAHLYVNDHLERLMTESAEYRLLASMPKRSLRERLASVAGVVRSVFTDQAPASNSAAPATR